MTLALSKLGEKVKNSYLELDWIESWNWIFWIPITIVIKVLFFPLELYLNKNGVLLYCIRYSYIKRVVITIINFDLYYARYMGYRRNWKSSECQTRWSPPWSPHFEYLTAYRPVSPQPLCVSSSASASTNCSTNKSLIRTSLLQPALLNKWLVVGAIDRLTMTSG